MPETLTIDPSTALLEGFANRPLPQTLGQQVG
jgi:hypothetical protein